MTKYFTTKNLRDLADDLEYGGGGGGGGDGPSWLENAKKGILTNLAYSPNLGDGIVEIFQCVSGLFKTCLSIIHLMQVYDDTQLWDQMLEYLSNENQLEIIQQTKLY